MKGRTVLQIKLDESLAMWFWWILDCGMRTYNYEKGQYWYKIEKKKK